MPTNLYADTTQFIQRILSGNAPDANDLNSVEYCLEASSRMVDRFANRWFYDKSETRVFDGTGRDPSNTDYLAWATRTLYTQSFSFLRIPDCISASSVKLDQDTDGTFELSLTPTTDYYLLNEGAENQDAPPFDKLQLNIFTGQINVFSSRPRLIQIVGHWGYTNATVSDSGTTATLASASTTAMTTNQAGSLARGQTLLLDSEQVYVAGSSSATSWTVTRALNGTTAAAHAAAAVNRYVYDPSVREATIIQAGRLFERRKSSYANVVINPAIGSIEINKGVDADLAELLWPLRRKFV